MPLLLLQKRSQLRLALAMIGCLSPVLAFPVPGTQVSLGTLPILVGLVVATSDWLDAPAKSASIQSLVARPAFAIIVLMMLLTTGVFGKQWMDNAALDQPGCRWVRLAPDRVATERAVADGIRKVDSPWLAFDSHNHNRFFFWTGKRPLTSTSPTFWPAMLTDDQKAKIESAVEQADSLCVVKLNSQRVLLSDYAPSLGDALYRSWALVEGVGEWQIGHRADDK